MATPLRRHWYDNGAVPVATTEKFAAAGTVTVTFAGGVVICGGMRMVSLSVALLLLETGSVTLGAWMLAVLVSVPLAFDATVALSV